MCRPAASWRAVATIKASGSIMPGDACAVKRAVARWLRNTAKVTRAALRFKCDAAGRPAGFDRVLAEFAGDPAHGPHRKGGA